MSLYELSQRPAPYAPSASIWTDPYIAPQMLKAHLDDSMDAASYRPARRQRICACQWEKLALAPGKRLIDVGCGPGLYAELFAARGARVTGIDWSQHSIDYARQRARQAKHDIQYIVGDYRAPFGAERFDAAIMVSEDFGVLCPADRAALLGNIYAALTPGGRLAMDLASDAVWDTKHEGATWYAEAAGFMRPHPHVVLKRTFLFPEERAYCDAFIVCDDALTLYYTHQTVYTPERITAELAAAGFVDIETGGGLDGTPYDGTGLLVSVIARRP